MAVRENWANAEPPVRGSTKAVDQHKAMALGYEVAGGPLVTDIHQAEPGTGETKIPGYTGGAGWMKRGRKDY